MSARRSGAARALDPTILRAYDIRGIVGKTLSEADATAIGRAFGTAVREGGGRSVCVGYDGRLHSPALEAALVDGLECAGTAVIRVGLGPTPMLYFAVRSFGADAGVMVSGSHNPPDYNGFKLLTAAGAFHGEDIQRLGRIAAGGAFASGAGTSEDRPALEPYVERIAADFDGARPLKVAWDAGNGAAGEAMRMLCGRLPGSHVLLNEEIDGTFPAHHPDPAVEDNLRQLVRCVAERGCELGIAFDGDGDRLGVVDRKGRILWGDQILMLLARDILGRLPGATVIADVKASQTLFDEIARLGGVPLMWRTGHSLIKDKMAETGAALAGEMSGHIFIADGYYGYDDALYAAVRLLGVLSRSEQTLTELRDRLPATVATPELRFRCPDARKFAVVEEIRRRLRGEGAEMSEVDGVRVRTDDGWWLLRASNTEDALVARCEAADGDGLARLRASLTRLLDGSGIDAGEV
ncbi:MAG: phosphomannomutase/phosphoglucomutase [Defluviicoccus sp.]|nr:phosphomannomutase/phosphoglucomutase [Defluviicoccus sp.]MDE0385127.1 phosphomannomutase/phosphoglucomutase [Defluviicoccus sp.]